MHSKRTAKPTTPSVIIPGPGKWFCCCLVVAALLLIPGSFYTPPSLSCFDKRVLVLEAPASWSTGKPAKPKSRKFLRSACSPFRHHFCGHLRVRVTRRARKFMLALGAEAQVIGLVFRHFFSGATTSPPCRHAAASFLAEFNELLIPLVLLLHLPTPPTHQLTHPIKGTGF